MADLAQIFTGLLFYALSYTKWELVVDNYQVSLTGRPEMVVQDQHWNLYEENKTYTVLLFEPFYLN